MFWRKFQIFSLLIFFTFFLNFCKKRVPDEDIQDCDRIFNYYENGVHYIRRDLIREDGVWDYKKLLDDSKIQRSDCYPAKEVDLEDKIELRK